MTSGDLTELTIKEATHLLRLGSISASDLVTPKVTTGPLIGSRKVYSKPEAAPETTLTPLSSWVHAVIVGFGPMYAASI